MQKQTSAYICVRVTQYTAETGSRVSKCLLLDVAVMFVICSQNRNHVVSTVAIAMQNNEVTASVTITKYLYDHVIITLIISLSYYYHFMLRHYHITIIPLPLPIPNL